MRIARRTVTAVDIYKIQADVFDIDIDVDVDVDIDAGLLCNWDDWDDHPNGEMFSSQWPEPLG